MADRHEVFAKKLFASRYGLDLRKIREASSKTPDFDVYAGDAHVAVLELKALEPTAPVYTLETIPEDDDRDRSEPDNCVSRVAAKIHEASKQLESTSLPKVLVLLNNRTEADEYDLQEALRGYLTYGDEKVVTLGPEVLKRVAIDRWNIDLYVWLEIDSDKPPRVVITSDRGRVLRERHFQLGPSVDAG